MVGSYHRSRSPTAEELALWHEAMRGTVPLRPSQPSVGMEPLATALPLPTRLLEDSKPSSVIVPSRGPRSLRAGLPALEVGESAGIDRRTDQRLRRGQLPLEGRLDLHGMTQAAAHDSLSRFIEESQRVGQRCVLVITGKGPVGQGGGILRTSVPRWLAEPGLRRHIIAVHRAQGRDGGDGALYILLKRRRNP